MSETSLNESEVSQDELETLKNRADTMGVTYHPSIGADKLKEKIQAKLDSQAVVKTEVTAAPVVEKKLPETEGQRRARLKKETSALVRVRITCMNPNKREWDGEIFTCGNSVVGTYRKLVPFNVDWHIPQIMLNVIQERQCQIFESTRDTRGNVTRRGKLIKEFAVDILPPLKEKELKALAQRQAMAAGTSEV